MNVFGCQVSITLSELYITQNYLTMKIENSSEIKKTIFCYFYFLNVKILIIKIFAFSLKESQKTIFSHKFNKKKYLSLKIHKIDLFFNLFFI